MPDLGSTGPWLPPWGACITSCTGRLLVVQTRKAMHGSEWLSTSDIPAAIKVFMPVVEVYCQVAVAFVYQVVSLFWKAGHHHCSFTERHHMQFVTWQSPRH
jgi:hypothetical protein